MANSEITKLEELIEKLKAERDYFKNQTAELADYIEKIEPEKSQSS